MELVLVDEVEAAAQIPGADTGQDVEVVDFEFGRAVFRSPFAVEVQYQNDELVDAQKVAAVAPGRLDGFFDDGVVLDDTRDVDRCRRHVRILESFERRVYTWENRKDAWFRRCACGVGVTINMQTDFFHVVLVC